MSFASLCLHLLSRQVVLKQVCPQRKVPRTICLVASVIPASLASRLCHHATVPFCCHCRPCSRDVPTEHCQKAAEQERHLLEMTLDREKLETDKATFNAQKQAWRSQMQALQESSSIERSPSSYFFSISSFDTYQVTAELQCDNPRILACLDSCQVKYLRQACYSKCPTHDTARSQPLLEQCTRSKSMPHAHDFPGQVLSRLDSSEVA